MSARDELMQSPRRFVRWVYLVDVWPEGQQRDGDIARAILDSPAEACVAAMARDLETYGRVLDEARSEAAAAKAELEQLRGALRVVGEALNG